MPLLTLGISHHTAPIEVREKVAINRSQYADRISQLTNLEGVEEAVIIGTCNRTEIYCLCSSNTESSLLQWLHEINDLPAGTLDSYFYKHEGKEAVRHLMQVAGGLDSLVLGEPQILGQLKEAWQLAVEAGGAGKVLDRLFQSTFSAAKSVRTHSGIGSHPVSVAYTAVTLARQIFGDLSAQNVVLVGAGDMIRLCGKHLIEQGIAHIEIVNRSLDTAQELATELNARVNTLDALAEVLPRADILISSTSSPSPIISRGAIKSALKKRRYRPMFLVDIAVPRDIDPEVRKLDDVYLYSIDDLQQVVDENKQQRNVAAEKARTGIDLNVEAFMRWLYGIRAARSLKKIRSQSHDHENALVEKAVKRIQAGHDPEQVLSQMASTLTNRILHQPSQRLREAAEEQEYQILKAADWIFRGESGQDEE
jgi:glutamyl-tRNA reductase